MADNAIELDAVTKRFSDDHALRGVTFTAPVGSVLGVLPDGGPTLWPVLQSVGWVVGLVAVFGPMAVRGYRAAAESGS